jgi:signal transduction histidine kinase
VRLHQDGALLVEVRDDGVGLTSMRERAVELGGTLRVEPAPIGGGTMVTASLPVSGG